MKKMLGAIFVFFVAFTAVANATMVEVTDPGQPQADQSLDGAYTKFAEVLLTSDDPLQEEKICLLKVVVNAVLSCKDGADPSGNLTDYLSEIVVATDLGKIIARRKVSFQGNQCTMILKVKPSGYFFQRPVGLVIMGVPKGPYDGQKIITLKFVRLKLAPSEKDQTKVGVTGLPVVGTGQESGIYGPAPRVFLTWRKTMNAGKFVRIDAPDEDVTLQRCIMGPDKTGSLNQSAVLGTIITNSMYSGQWDIENDFQWYDIGTLISLSEMLICVNDPNFFQRYKFGVGATGFVFTDNAGHRLIPQYQ